MLGQPIRTSGALAFGMLGFADRQSLERLAESAPIKQLPPGTLNLLGNALFEVGAGEPALALLLRSQQQYPGDLWLNDTLAAANLWHLKPPRYDKALRYYAAALAVRPDNYRIHDMIGIILRIKKSWKAAEIAFSRAIELRPDDPYCRTKRTCNYLDMGQLDLAIVDFSKAIDLDPLSATAYLRHHNLGIAFQRKGLLDEAIGKYRDAIRLQPNYASAHYSSAWSSVVRD